MNDNKAIKLRKSIAEIVNAYEDAMRKLDEGYAVLLEAENQLKEAFLVSEKHDTDFAVLPSRYYDSNANVTPEVIKSVKAVILRRVWRTLYDLLEVDRIASIKRRDEISKMLERGELPEISVQSVYDLFDALHQNINEFAREAVLEVYRWLRPNVDYHEMTTYKTNQKNARYEVGQKVIKTRMIESLFQNRHVNYSHEKYLIALDRVFHMLDGKNILETSHRSPLVDAINSAEAYVMEIETEYFRCKMYNNGNLHITFTRPDLLKEFNRIAGGNNLKPIN